MSRFSLDKPKTSNPVKRLILTCAFFIALVLIFFYAMGTLSSGSTDRQKDSLYKALNKNIIYHYAVTGSYPATLEQIEELYGLSYDHKLFFVDYVVHGTNIMPEITILEREQG